MKRPLDIAKEEVSMNTLVQLTGAFEGIASLRVAQTKNQVTQAQFFFNELWSLYNQLRIDSLFRFGRDEEEKPNNKDLFIIITAEGGFSGDIDQRLVNMMLKEYDPKKQDIIIIGHHGAVQLGQVGVQFKRFYRLPTKDIDVNVEPLIRHVKEYKNTTVFYQSYVSLMSQEIKKIDLITAVEQQVDKSIESKDEISEGNYIFEPSTFAVISHLERSMLQISLSQLLLDSKLAQYASRFQAMSVANDRVTNSLSDLKMEFYRSKRALADERLKEIITGVKKAIARQG